MTWKEDKFYRAVVVGTPIAGGILGAAIGTVHWREARLPGGEPLVP